VGAEDLKFEISDFKMAVAACEQRAWRQRPTRKAASLEYDCLRVIRTF
jgi:hypothetical protein